MSTIHALLGISESEFVGLMESNCNLKAACSGYAAELIAKTAMERVPGVIEVVKMSDHDRSHRYDFLVRTQQRDIRVEVKRLTDSASGVKVAKNYRSTIEVAGHRIYTNQLPRTSYDVLCIVTPNGVVYMKTCDIPIHGNYKKYPEEVASMLLPRFLKSNIITEQASSDFPLT